MSRGNRLLGIVEVVEELEDLQPLIERLVMADGQITPDEQELLDCHRYLLAGSQSLSVRTQIGMSLVRGLAEPPERASDLMEQYHARHGQPALAAD